MFATFSCKGFFWAATVADTFRFCAADTCTPKYFTCGTDARHATLSPLADLESKHTATSGALVFKAFTAASVVEGMCKLLWREGRSLLLQEHDQEQIWHNTNVAICCGKGLIYNGVIVLAARALSSSVTEKAWITVESRVHAREADMEAKTHQGP
jgi:hypothetical protein